MDRYLPFYSLVLYLRILFILCLPDGGPHHQSKSWLQPSPKLLNSCVYASYDPCLLDQDFHGAQLCLDLRDMSLCDRAFLYDWLVY
jgi:hypothetical protein